MRFPAPLVRATLVRRYKRFLADVALADGSVQTAHVANPGAMPGLAVPGATVWLSRSTNPARKLPLSWELVETELGSGSELVVVNTAHANTVAAEALAHGAITELAGYEIVRREVKYGARSRIDFLLSGPGRPPCYVEVKAVTLMRRPGLSEFPDARTVRGARHLEELGVMAAAGHRAVMLFLIQIPSADGLALACDIDPHYGRAFDRALAAGVEALAYRCDVSCEEIAVAYRVPLLAQAGSPRDVM